jgi:hypothetical protein
MIAQIIARDLLAHTGKDNAFYHIVTDLYKVTIHNLN